MAIRPDVFLGALQPYQMGARRHRRRQDAFRWGRPSWPSFSPGHAALLPIAFPALDFTNAVGTNVLSVQANPQTTFMGQRLAVQVLRNGATAATVAPILDQLLVGPRPTILTSPGPALETFAQNAFDTNIMLPPSSPGMIYQLTSHLTGSLGVADTLTALISLIGSVV